MHRPFSFVSQSAARYVRFNCRKNLHQVAKLALDMLTGFGELSINRNAISLAQEARDCEIGQNRLIKQAIHGIMD